VLRYRTLEDLVRAATDLLTLVSCRAQYLSRREDVPEDCRKDADAIIFQTGLVVGCLSTIPARAQTIVIGADRPEPDREGGR